MYSLGAFVNDYHFTFVVYCYWSNFCFKSRFKKASVKGLQNDDKSLPKESTSEQSQCPLLFKFNEVYFFCILMLINAYANYFTVVFIFFHLKGKPKLNAFSVN